MKNQKILVYGFEPFLQYTKNVTEDIVEQLSRDSGVVGHIFPVVFDSAMFTQKLNEICPSLVIGMGQDSRARKIRIERKAQNQRRNHLESNTHRIAKNGPEHLFCNSSVNKPEGTTVTYDAGTYVCNFSMYVCLEYCIPKGVPYTFLHIPVGANPKQAARTVRDILHFQTKPL